MSDETKMIRVPKGTTARDWQAVEKQRILAAALGLKDDRWGPALKCLAHLALVEQRCYDHLRDHPIVRPDGEFLSSIDAFKRVVDSEVKLLEALGGLPNAEASVEAADKVLAATWERIEQIRHVRKTHERKAAKAITVITGNEPA